MFGIRFKLSVMMFLQFFIWGAWLPPSFGFFDALGFNEWQKFGVNIAFPVSAIIAMFFANQFVDRNFAAEKFLAFSHFVGGLAMLAFGGMAWMTFRAEDPQQYSYWLYFAAMAVHCFFYVPTISVTNAIAFANMKDSQKEFGIVRLWGTIGWIAASWPFIFILVNWAAVPSLGEAGFVNWLGTALGTPLGAEPKYVAETLNALPNQDPAFLAEQKKLLLDKDQAYQAGLMALNQGKSWAFLVAGIGSLVLAAFSLTLPHTPPKPATSGEDAFALLGTLSSLFRYPFMVVLFVATFIDATVHDGYFIYAFTYLGKVGVPQNWIQPAMSVGQIAEIGTMAILGMVLARFGWRYTLIVGILGHAVRFAVWGLVPNPYLAVAVNVLHGICYAFFFATLYILVDEVFPKDARTSAQGLFNFLILGLGPIVGRYLWPGLEKMYTSEKTIQYNPLFLYPSGAAVVAALLLLLFFHPPRKGTATET